MNAAVPPHALEFDAIDVTFRSRDGQDHAYTAVAATTLHVAAGEFVSVARC